MSLNVRRLAKAEHYLVIVSDAKRLPDALLRLLRAGLAEMVKAVKLEEEDG